MTPKRIYVLDGHPAAQSLSRALAETYADAARDAGHDVRLAHLANLAFDADHGVGGYRDMKPVEPDLDAVIEDLRWAEHVVLVAPMWWGGLPGRLKGLFDRALLPGRTFSTREQTAMGFPKPLLTGRTARFVVTSDTPWWLMLLGYGNALFRQMRHQVFGFVGIRPMRVTHLVGATKEGATLLPRWRARMQALGRAAA